MVGPVTQKNYTGGTVIGSPTTTPWVRVVAVLADATGSVHITDSDGIMRLELYFGAPGFVLLPGDGVQFKGGATMTMTGITNLGLFTC